jgi:hypothetical protein
VQEALQPRSGGSILVHDPFQAAAAKGSCVRLTVTAAAEPRGRRTKVMLILRTGR